MPPYQTFTVGFLRVGVDWNSMLKGYLMSLKTLRVRKTREDCLNRMQFSRLGSWCARRLDLEDASFSLTQPGSEQMQSRRLALEPPARITCTSITTHATFPRLLIDLILEKSLLSHATAVNVCLLPPQACVVALSLSVRTAPSTALDFVVSSRPLFLIALSSVLLRIV